MVFGCFNSRFFAGVALSGLMLAAAGCQSSDKGLFSGAKTAVPDTRVKASDLSAYCPTITLREGTAYFNTYAKGTRKANPDDGSDADDNSDNIVYQAAITDVTRDCTRNAGQLTLNVAVAGKVVPGPKGGTGAITMPIRIVVLHGSDILYSQLHQYKLQITDASAATQFMFNEPNITIPEPTDRGYQIFAGFDEGPPSKKKK